MFSSHRVCKPKPPKSSLSSLERRKQLSAAISEFGTKMPTPCDACVRNQEKDGGLDCKIDLRSGRCSRCSRWNRKCSLIVTRHEWDRIKRERQKLSRQIADADRALEELLRKRVELRRQWDTLEEEAGEAVIREQENIEELERLEAAARVEPEVELDLSSDAFIGQGVLQMPPSDWALIDHDPFSFLEIPNSQPEVRL